MKKRKRKAKKVKTKPVTPKKITHDGKLRDWMGHDISEVEGWG